MTMYVDEDHDRVPPDPYFWATLPASRGSRELDPMVTVYCPLATIHSRLAPSQ